jgi:hypothetical protein
MRKEFKTKLNGDESRKDATASFTLPFNTREVWGKARVPVEVTINGYAWRSTVGNRGGIQYIVVNAEARRDAGVKAGDFVTIALSRIPKSGRYRFRSLYRRYWAPRSPKSSTAYRSRTKNSSWSGIPKPREKTHVLAELRR